MSSEWALLASSSAYLTKAHSGAALLRLCGEITDAYPDTSNAMMVVLTTAIIYGDEKARIHIHGQ